MEPGKAGSEVPTPASSCPSPIRRTAPPRRTGVIEYSDAEAGVIAYRLPTQCLPAVLPPHPVSAAPREPVRVRGLGHEATHLQSRYRSLPLSATIQFVSEFRQPCPKPCVAPGHPNRRTQPHGGAERLLCGKALTGGGAQRQPHLR